MLRRFGGNEDERRALLRSRPDHRARARSGARRRAPLRSLPRPHHVSDPRCRGRVIAFGGRVLDQGEPKYLNSPRPRCFTRAASCMACTKRAAAALDLKRLLIVEGYMDTVRLHQAGITIRRGDARHGDDAGALQADLPPGERSGVRIRRRSRRPRGRLARAATGAARGARGPRDPLPVSARRAGSGLAGRRGRARGLREAARRSACPLSEYLVRELAEPARSESRRRARAFCRERAAAVGAHSGRACIANLLLGRIAQVVGLCAARLQELWSGAARRGSTRSGARPQRRAARARRAAPVGAAVWCVRRSLRLVQFPAIASRSAMRSAPALERLRGARHRAAARAAGQLADTPGAEPGAGDRALGGQARMQSRCEKLLQQEQVMADAAAAAEELRAGSCQARAIGWRCGACRRWRRSSPRPRLATEEMQEFQRLTMRHTQPRMRAAVETEFGVCNGLSNTIVGFALAPLSCRSEAGT